MPVKQKYAIGVGARVVDPLLGALFPEDCLFSPQKTMLRLAYLTKHAKEQEANVGPGGSKAIYIPSVGLARWIDPVDLHFAEENVQFIDELISYTLQLVMGFWPEEEVQRVAETCRGLIVNIANTIRENVSFPSLEAEAPSDEQKGA